MNKKYIYWICQFGGWLLIVLLNAAYLNASNKLNEKVTANLFIVFFTGIIATHFYRLVILKSGWLTLSFGKQVPRILVSVILLSLSWDFLQQCFNALLSPEDFSSSRFRIPAILVRMLNLSFLLILWSLLYFLYHYIENYRRAEILNLKWQASVHETELNKLKSQLNPHFMFNAMNGIRALVDENPARAKEAITQLSNILRNTLLMGKNKVISFEEEYKIVKDYLELESMRLEERLSIRIDLDPESRRFMVPPLMIQTLVENGIKHGIAKIPGGGTLQLNSVVKNNRLTIKILNSGHLTGINGSETGFGIKNTAQRLNLLYGDKASFRIFNKGEKTVVTEIEIPDTIIPAFSEE